MKLPVIAFQAKAWGLPALSCTTTMCPALRFPRVDQRACKHAVTRDRCHCGVGGQGQETRSFGREVFTCESLAMSIAQS
jgi:hypothetical protein